MKGVRVYRIQRCWCGHASRYFMVVRQARWAGLVCPWHRDLTNWPPDVLWTIQDGQ